MFASVGVSMRCALDRQIDGLSGPRCPDDLGRVSIDKLGHLLPCLLHRLLGFLAEAVRTRRGVAERPI